MDVNQAIRTRRSVGKVAEEMPDRALIEKILEAARWAPNHHMTQPWKYTVLTGSARNRLGDVLAEIKAESMTEEEQMNASHQLEQARQKPLRAPVIIAAAVNPSLDPRVEEIEEICAVAAGVQNALLTAHALGLGAIWRTGKQTYSPKMKRFFGLSERETLLGFLYIGHPAALPRERPRLPIADKVTWLET
ncbi:nitroreductase family protein [Desmospora profundinema]|uniref:Putative NAD(P)H nitroreductase n=1 Tax=Desmospora profundinema TaxID=1571184 RepID=A0ABU1IME2_9BACL|nr:nitroreductase [Desmospora profundinema]MDR6225908.1 nitroreductase [Desmospora profundinema]